MYHRIAAAAAALLLAWAGSAFGQGWPNKPIKWINPFPAGGGTDAFARPLAAKLTTALGQTVFIENLGGAGGTVGAGVAAKAAPDGYTFFVGAIHHTIAESLYTKLPYAGLEKDFEPVTVLAYVPNIFSPFFTTKPQGSGLGLVIVRKIVNAHDGQIDMSPRATGGTCFSVTLPLGSSGQLFD